MISINTRSFSEQESLEATVEAANNNRGKVTGTYSSERVHGFASYLGQDAPFDKGRKSFIGGDTYQPLDEEYQFLSINNWRQCGQ